MKTLALLLFALVAAGCMTTKPVVVAKLKQPVPEGLHKALELRFEEVSFRHVDMSFALTAMSREINRQGPNVPKFVTSLLAYVDGKPASQTRKQLNLEMKDATLQEILEVICEQTGWQYKQSPLIYQFTPRPKS